MCFIKLSVFLFVDKVVVETKGDDVKPLYMIQLLNLLHRLISTDSDAKNLVTVSSKSVELKLHYLNIHLHFGEEFGAWWSTEVKLGRWKQQLIIYVDDRLERMDVSSVIVVERKVRRGVETAARDGLCVRCTVIRRNKLRWFDHIEWKDDDGDID